ncbi:hypothetical protein [Halolamina sp. C58]|uniref:hypothetical protein n=1 Tax=Halolamina sp. C58 TaxID=3421640 RepID=UPI003EBCA823
MTEDDLFRNDLPNKDTDGESTEHDRFVRYGKIGLAIVGLYGVSVLLLSAI